MADGSARKFERAAGDHIGKELYWVSRRDVKYCLCPEPGYRGFYVMRWVDGKQIENGIYMAGAWCLARPSMQPIRVEAEEWYWRQRKK
jgi:hypothetical protein